MPLAQTNLKGSFSKSQESKIPLLNSYEVKKDAIRKRLEDFKETGKGSNEQIFEELCFCLCTPQSKAKACDIAVKKLAKNRLLFEASEEEIVPYLKDIRFPRSKVRYIVEARKLFLRNGSWNLREQFAGFSNPSQLREWLVKSVKGLGYKEASHFLRNIGLGQELAILDRHILKNLVEYGVIPHSAESLSRKEYLEIERKMRIFSSEIGIPMAELDLLLWSEETGEIFK